MTKIKSRKLWAWIIATVMMFAFLSFHKDAVIPFIPYYGGITMIYIGFQAIVDFIPAILEIVKVWRNKG